eukprot:s126_g21.t1
MSLPPRRASAAESCARRGRADGTDLRAPGAFRRGDPETTGGESGSIEAKHATRSREGDAPCCIDLPGFLRGEIILTGLAALAKRFPVKRRRATAGRSRSATVMCIVPFRGGSVDTDGMTRVIPFSCRWHSDVCVV